MISTYAPCALWHRSSFFLIGVLLVVGSFFAGSSSISDAAETHASTTAPSVDVAYKDIHPPQYPIEAVEKGEEGTVMLDVTVDVNGNVMNIAVDQEGTHAATDLQSAAVAAVSKWKFNPGMKDGYSVGGTVEVPVSFGIGMTCPEGFITKGRQFGSNYSCIATPSAAQNSPKQCLDGYQYKQGRDNSFECISKPASSTSS